MGLEKAFIEILDGAKGGTTLPVLFNPAEYSLERGNAFKSTPVPGLGSPLIQFINGDAATLSMELFLDDITDPEGPVGAKGPVKSVDKRIAEITALLDIDRTLHAPPTLRFVWGPLRFTAVLEKVGRKVTLFRPDGTPGRATLAVAFREYRTIERQLDAPRRESADKTKRRQIDAAEDLWLIADREYGDVRAWRVIAADSDVDDPRSLRPGDWLRVPPWEGPDGLRRAL
jgi:nucleoid-associated protein YgaU